VEGDPREKQVVRRGKKECGNLGRWDEKTPSAFEVINCCKKKNSDFEIGWCGRLMKCEEEKAEKVERRRCQNTFTC